MNGTCSCFYASFWTDALCCGFCCALCPVGSSRDCDEAIGSASESDESGVDFWIGNASGHDDVDASGSCCGCAFCFGDGRTDVTLLPVYYPWSCSPRPAST